MLSHDPRSRQEGSQCRGHSGTTIMARDCCGQSVPPGNEDLSPRGNKPCMRHPDGSRPVSRRTSFSLAFLTLKSTVTDTQVGVMAMPVKISALFRLLRGMKGLLRRCASGSAPAGLAVNTMTLNTWAQCGLPANFPNFSSHLCAGEPLDLSSHVTAAQPPVPHVQ